nr:CNP1-like family protein [Neisseria meningitidis]
MRRTALLLLALTAGTSLAAGFSQKDTPINTRYRETPEEAAAREFKEHTAKLPPLPDTHSDGWFDIYVDENYGKQPKILLDSLQIMPAPDGSIRYILNIRSDKGYDNLTAEGIFCARFSIRFGNGKPSSYKVFGYGKPSSYKVFGYGDTVNRRWIQPRNAEWKPIGGTLSRNDALRTVLYQAFCEGGVPADTKGLVQRLKERAGRYAPSIKPHNK